MKSIGILFISVFMLCSCKSMEERIALKKSIRAETTLTKKVLSAMLHENRLYVEQGKLLMERGTTASIQKYGERMVADRTLLIVGIENAAEQAKIHLASALTRKDKILLRQLSDKMGNDFDKKSLKVIATDYKTDLSKMERMTYSNSALNSLNDQQVALTRTQNEKIETLRAMQYERHFSMRAKYRAWNRGYLFSLILGQFLI